MRLSLHQPITLLFAIMALLGLSATTAALADDSSLCAEQTAHVERMENTPMGLLSAISMVESGRWDANRRASIAWPWTIYADGRGMFFPTKQAAIDEVRKLRSQGIRSIDVGCMQVNMFYHAKAFGSLEEAFDPGHNVAYAAKFLKDLFDEMGSWSDAAAAYHSRNEEEAAPYRKKVLAIWNGRKDQPMDGLQAFASAAEDLRARQAAQRQQQLAAEAAERQQRLAKITAERETVRNEANAYRATMIAAYLERKAQLAAAQAQQHQQTQRPNQRQLVSARIPTTGAQPVPPVTAPLQVRPASAIAMNGAQPLLNAARPSYTPIQRTLPLPLYEKGTRMARPLPVPGRAAPVAENGDGARQFPTRRPS